MTENNAQTSKKRKFNDERLVLDFIKKVATEMVVPVAICSNCVDPIFGEPIQIEETGGSTVYNYCVKCTKWCDKCACYFLEDDAKKHENCALNFSESSENFHLSLTEYDRIITLRCELVPTENFACFAANYVGFVKVVNNGDFTVLFSDFREKKQHYWELYKMHQLNVFGDDGQSEAKSEFEKNIASTVLEKIESEQLPESFMCKIDSKCGKAAIRVMLNNFKESQKLFGYTTAFCAVTEKEKAIALFKRLKNALL